MNQFLKTRQHELSCFFGFKDVINKKWEKDEIDDDTYDKNCPYRYELYQCSCDKWTINYKRRES